MHYYKQADLKSWTGCQSLYVFMIKSYNSQGCRSWWSHAHHLNRINRTNLKDLNSLYVLLPIKCFKTIPTNISLSDLKICLHRSLIKKIESVCSALSPDAEGLLMACVMWGKWEWFMWRGQYWVNPGWPFSSLTSHVNGKASELVLYNNTHTQKHMTTHPSPRPPPHPASCWNPTSPVRK